MTFRVLQSWAENKRARQTLTERGLGFWPAVAPRRLLDRLRGQPPIVVGEYNKSWDVLLSIDAVAEHAGRNDLVVDLGAFASEVPVALYLAGFRHVVGVDLNPRIRSMPFPRQIDWRVGDMTATDIASGTAAAVVAISSIEHGDPRHVLREAARLLKPGGIFAGSTDYWPQKIVTDEVTMFGLPWRIFSSEEILRFIADAERYDLRPAGSVELLANEGCIDACDRLYTFGWFCFVKGRP